MRRKRRGDNSSRLNHRTPVHWQIPSRQKCHSGKKQYLMKSGRNWITFYNKGEKNDQKEDKPEFIRQIMELSRIFCGVQD